MGFRVAAGLFTASEVGASHRRERLFILAHANGNNSGAPRQNRKKRGSTVGVGDAGEHMAHANGQRGKASNTRSTAGKLAIDASGSDEELADTTTRKRDNISTAGSDDERQGDGFTIGGCGVDVADSRRRRGNGRQIGERPIKRRKAERQGGNDCIGSATLADTYSQRLQGIGSNATEIGWEDAGGSTGLCDGADIPAFPPGPNALDLWRAILQTHPHLEPAIRRVADGTASRMDELRALGNGVVPAVAARAFVTLYQALTSKFEKQLSLFE